MLQSFKRGRKKESVYRARLTSKLRAKKYFLRNFKVYNLGLRS